MTTTRRAALRVLIVAATLFAAGRAEAANDRFADAGRAYAEGRFADAIALYEALRSEGLQHPSLHVNLGSAYYRAGRLGPAILSYERALELDPDDEDARFDLEVAREAAAARFGADTIVGGAADPLWMRVVGWLPLATVSWVFFALDLLFFAALLAIRFLPTGLLRSGLIAGNVFVGLAGLVFGVLVAGRAYVESSVRMGVVVADVAVMHEGTDERQRAMFTLHAGHRARLLHEADGSCLVRAAGGAQPAAGPAEVERCVWTLVRLANGVEGYVRREHVEEI